MRVVTTVHRAGFEQYGHRWIDGIKNWPEAEFWMYAEGFATEAVKCKRVEDLERLAKFKLTCVHYKPISWQWDVVRFANKVFAAHDAFYDYDGLCVWLDCDTVTYRPIPCGYIEGLIPEGFFMGQFNRSGYHTETGFWVMDGKHPEKKAFLDAMLEWYESGAFKQLHEWHDCTILDAVTHRFIREGRIRVTNLSGEWAKDMHPIAKSDLGRYIDHTKGARKDLGYSPENFHRAAA